MAHTKEKLSAMKFTELRAAAKELKINPMGKGQAALVREILKKQGEAAGKGTPADPKPKGLVKKPAAAKAEPEKAEPPKKREAPVEAAPVKAGLTEAEVRKMIDASTASVMAALKSHEDKATKQMDFVIAQLNETRAEVGLDAVALGGPPAPNTKKKVADEEEEEADEEDEDEEDEDEEVAEEADEEDEDEEEEETLDISAAELASANLDRLKEIAEAINESAGSEVVDVDVKSPRILRDSIREYLAENAEKVVEEEPRAKVAPTQEERTGIPDHIRIGSKVAVDVEGEGLTNAIVTGIDEDAETATLDFDDDTEAEAPWSEILPRAKKAKSRD